MKLWLPLAAFVAFISAMASRHAMWRDEVRAFSVATRTESWPDLINLIHHEGHPIVWYAILRVGYALTHSNLVLPLASLIIAAIAAFIILRFAPFPFWMRLLAVFGVFLGYEFSVISRNYGIGVMLLALACVLFPERGERPVRLALVLVLLANTSVHAIIATVVIGFVWLMDAVGAESRRGLLRPRSIAAAGIVFAGLAVALWSAVPPSNLSYGVSLSDLNPGEVLRTIMTHPARGLRGVGGADITASGELPWERIGINPALVSIVMVNISILTIAWSLRRNPACLIALALAIAAFEVLFRLIYSGSLRHEGFLAFIMISLVWIAAASAGRTAIPSARSRAIAFGLLPLLITQAAALPVVARRNVLHPASSSRSFAALIDSTPRFRNAILAGEPDYLMEPMPHYLPNPVFMPRQRQYAYRVNFDPERRKSDLRLGELLAIADSVGCASGRSVLLALAWTGVLTDTAGEARGAGYGATFRWNAEERARLFRRGRSVATFDQATGDENYTVFEIPPPLTARAPASGAFEERQAIHSSSPALPSCPPD